MAHVQSQKQQGKYVSQRNPWVLETQDHHGIDVMPSLGIHQVAVLGVSDEERKMQKMINKEGKNDQA